MCAQSTVIYSNMYVQLCSAKLYREHVSMLFGWTPERCKRRKPFDTESSKHGLNGFPSTPPHPPTQQISHFHSKDCSKSGLV